MGETGACDGRCEHRQAESESTDERLRPPAKPGKEHDIDDRERIKLWAVPCSQSAASHD